MIKRVARWPVIGMLVKPVIASIVAVALLYHVLVGCCDHHAHAASGTAVVPITANSGDAVAHNDCDERHSNHQHSDRSTPNEEQSEPDSPTSPAHSPGGCCCGGSCSYIVVKAQDVDSPLLTIAVLCAIADADLTTTSPQIVGRLLDSAHGPPIRPHLLYQVMLI